MICSSWRIIDNFVPLIDRKTDSDWLVDTEQMTEVIPAPWCLDDFICPIHIKDV